MIIKVAGAFDNPGITDIDEAFDFQGIFAGKMPNARIKGAIAGFNKKFPEAEELLKNRWLVTTPTPRFIKSNESDLTVGELDQVIGDAWFVTESNSGIWKLSEGRLYNLQILRDYLRTCFSENKHLDEMASGIMSHRGTAKLSRHGASSIWALYFMFCHGSNLHGVLTEPEVLTSIMELEGFL